MVRQWQELMRAYLAGRPTLRRAYLLIDSRHGVKPADEEIMTLLDRSAVSFQLVLTKADKPRAAALAATIARVTQALQRHVAAHPLTAVTSSETGAGLAALRAEIAGLAAG